MGLDLVLYTAKKMYDYDSERELAYGRKTWAIAEFFMRRCQPQTDQYTFEVDEETWDDFMNAITPYLSNKDFFNLIENYDPYTEADYNWQIEEVIKFFLDNALENDEPYTLGIPWEAKALLRWYEADKEVRKLYEEDQPVFLCVSFQVIK